MGQIATQIQIFNKVFKVAWDLAVEQSQLTPDLGSKLGDAVKRALKNGATDPEEIGKAAFDSLRS